MVKHKNIVFVIAVIGTIACFLSFLIALFVKEQFLAGLIFVLAGLFCLSTAIGIHKRK